MTKYPKGYPDHYHGYLLSTHKFLSRFVEDPTTNCWNWTGAKHNQGYGMLGAFRISDEKFIMMTAHRMSWLIHHGPVTSPNVMHMCHNPACVNPAHLALGTQKDNMKKMIAAGRQNRNRNPRVPYVYNTSHGRHPSYGQMHVRPRNPNNWQYKYSPEEIQFLRTASVEDICIRFNQQPRWAYARRWSARKGYKWLPWDQNK